MTLDEAIILLRQGNQDGFTYVYRLFFSKFRNYFHYYTRRFDISEELAHDVFLKLWVHRDKLPDSLNIESYLFMMARNSLFNHLKRQKKEATVHQLVTEKTPVTIDPGLQQVYQQALDEYHEWLNNLDADHKQIFLLSREEGLTYQQIAAALGISAKMVKRKMEHTLKVMRNQLQPLSLVIVSLLILA